MIIVYKRYIYIGITVLIFGYVIGARVFDASREKRSISDESLTQNENAITAYADMIRVISPQPYEAVTSPLIIRGEARGQWFFEATFPITIVNWDGLIIGEGYAEALSDWMVDDFVPFEARISFDTSPDVHVYPRGTLILHKSNPSGLPEYDAVWDMPIEFAL